MPTDTHARGGDHMTNELIAQIGAALLVVAVILIAAGKREGY